MMSTFEYMMVTFERTARTVFSCAGFTFEGASEDSAREHFKAQLQAGALADTQRRRREARAANDAAYLRWVKHRDEKRKQFSIVATDSSAAHHGAAPQDRVTFPDGTTRTFPKGETLTRIDDEIVTEIGPPPPELESFDDMSDAQLLDHLLGSITRRPVDVWTATTEPAQPTATLPSAATRLDAAVVSVLNGLGGEGWQVVGISEDRAIESTDSRTSTVVVAARFTLMRDGGG